MMKITALSLVAVALVACGGNDKETADMKDPKCPYEAVQVAAVNQRVISRLMANETPASELREMSGPYRAATLSKDGARRDVGFYLTGIPACRWLSSWDALTPIVIEDGKVIGHGSQTLRDMTAQGWVIKDAVWPWQNYNFGYVPKR